MFWLASLQIIFGGQLYRYNCKSIKLFYVQNENKRLIKLFAGNIALHIMSPSERQRVDMESLWLNGPENDPKVNYPLSYMLLHTLSLDGTVANSSLLPLFLLSFHSCCSYAQVFRRTHVHEFNISYCHTEWYLFFFAR